MADVAASFRELISRLPGELRIPSTSSGVKLSAFKEGCYMKDGFNVAKLLIRCRNLMKRE